MKLMKIANVMFIVVLAGAALTGCKDRVLWNDNGALTPKTQNREVWNTNGKLESGSRTIWNDAQGKPVIK